MAAAGDDDVVRAILSFLCPDDLLTCRLVSRRWLQLASHNKIWKPIVAQRALGARVDAAVLERDRICRGLPWWLLAGAVSRVPTSVNTSCLAALDIAVVRPDEDGDGAANEAAHSAGAPDTPPRVLSVQYVGTEDGDRAVAGAPSHSQCIAVGLCSPRFPLSGRMPGWDRSSYGWHSDDGHKFHCSGIGTPFADAFGPGDTIGCGVDLLPCLGTAHRTHNPLAGRIFFTRNGRMVGYAFDRIDTTETWYPVVGLDATFPITFNFGADPGVPFQFPLERFVHAQWRAYTSVAPVPRRIVMQVPQDQQSESAAVAARLLHLLHDEAGAGDGAVDPAGSRGPDSGAAASPASPPLAPRGGPVSPSEMTLAELLQHTGVVGNADAGQRARAPVATATSPPTAAAVATGAMAAPAAAPPIASAAAGAGLANEPGTPTSTAADVDSAALGVRIALAVTHLRRHEPMEGAGSQWLARAHTPLQSPTDADEDTADLHSQFRARHRWPPPPSASVSAAGLPASATSAAAAPLGVAHSRSASFPPALAAGSSGATAATAMTPVTAAPMAAAVTATVTTHVSTHASPATTPAAGSATLPAAGASPISPSHPPPAAAAAVASAPSLDTSDPPLSPGSRFVRGRPELRTYWHLRPDPREAIALDLSPAALRAWIDANPGLFWRLLTLHPQPDMEHFVAAARGLIDASGATALVQQAASLRTAAVSRVAAAAGAAVAHMGATAGEAAQRVTAAAGAARSQVYTLLQGAGERWVEVLGMLLEMAPPPVGPQAHEQLAAAAAPPDSDGAGAGAGAGAGGVADDEVRAVISALADAAAGDAAAAAAAVDPAPDYAGGAARAGEAVTVTSVAPAPPSSAATPATPSSSHHPHPHPHQQQPPTRSQQDRIVSSLTGRAVEIDSDDD